IPTNIAIPGTTENPTGFAGDATPALSVRIYPASRQPYVTEVYANTASVGHTASTGDPLVDGIPNANGYVAIELYNPYHDPMVIPANGYLVLENYDPLYGDLLAGEADLRAANYRPPSLLVEARTNADRLAGTATNSITGQGWVRMDDAANPAKPPRRNF